MWRFWGHGPKSSCPSTWSGNISGALKRHLQHKWSNWYSWSGCEQVLIPNMWCTRREKVQLGVVRGVFGSLLLHCTKEKDGMAAWKAAKVVIWQKRICRKTFHFLPMQWSLPFRTSGSLFVCRVSIATVRAIHKYWDYASPRLTFGFITVIKSLVLFDVLCSAAWVLFAWFATPKWWKTMTTMIAKHCPPEGEVSEPTPSHANVVAIIFILESNQMKRNIGISLDCVRLSLVHLQPDPQGA